MSTHLLVDIVGHSLISHEDLFSYRDSFSKLVILSFLLTPDLAQLFLVIPEENYVVYLLIRFLRYISWICATFGYLISYGGYVWSSILVTSGVIAMQFGLILKFTSFFDIHLYIMATIGNIFFCIGALFIVFVTYRYIYQQVLLFKNSIQMSADDYCCNVYLFAFWITFTGLVFLLIFNDFPHWYDINVEIVVIETILFTVYYVVITVFQGKAALIDAIASKVSYGFKYAPFYSDCFAFFLFA